MVLGQTKLAGKNKLLVTEPVNYSGAGSRLVTVARIISAGGVKLSLYIYLSLRLAGRPLYLCKKGASASDRCAGYKGLYCNDGGTTHAPARLTSRVDLNL